MTTYRDRYPLSTREIDGVTVHIISPPPGVEPPAGARPAAAAGASAGVGASAEMGGSAGESSAAGVPWVWRAEFLGAFDDADCAMLDAGWHLVYVEVPDRYGDPVAMAAWWTAYRFLVDELGFDPRPGLIALSRGGLYAISWAAAHPDCVSAIYLDNAVCDLRSWPGGLGDAKPAPTEWQQMLKVYALDPTDLDAVAAISPISKLAPLAAARIPLLVAYGDADRAVPANENSIPLVANYTNLGGPSEVVIRPGADHHPHGIDPATVRAFFISHKQQRH